MAKPTKNKTFILFFPDMEKGGGIEKNFALLEDVIGHHAQVICLTSLKDANSIKIESDEVIIIGLRNSPATYILARRLRKETNSRVRVYYRLNNSNMAFWHERSLKKAIAEIVKLLVLRFFDGVLYNGQEMYAQYRLYARKRIYLPNFCYPPPSRGRKRASRDKKFIFAGRIVHQKNVIALAHALKACRGERITVDIYGDGNLMPKMQSILADVDWVTFKDWQEKVDYTRYDYCLLPSLYEGSPNALLEAVAAGVPAIITPFKSGGREIVEAVGGIVADGFNADAIASAIKSALASPPTINKKGRASVLQKHSESAIVEVLERL